MDNSSGKDEKKFPFRSQLLEIIICSDMVLFLTCYKNKQISVTVLKTQLTQKYPTYMYISYKLHKDHVSKFCISGGPHCMVESA